MSIPRDGFASARHDVRKGQRQGNRQRLTERTLPAPLSRTATAFSPGLHRHSPSTSLRGVWRQPPPKQSRAVSSAVSPGTTAIPHHVIARRVATATTEAISCGRHHGSPGGTSIPRDGFAPARHDVRKGQGRGNCQRLTEQTPPISTYNVTSRARLPSFPEKPGFHAILRVHPHQQTLQRPLCRCNEQPAQTPGRTSERVHPTGFYLPVQR